MTQPDTYQEKLSSNRTTLLFIVLSLLFLILFIWRAGFALYDGWGIIFFLFFLFFLFYTLNYRTLYIRIDKYAISLRFGLFTWNIPLANIETCHPDPVSLWRIGGAGIHFTLLGGRYRAMFNFLEFPRVVICLVIKKGPVCEIAFSTRHPEEVLQIFQEWDSLR